MSDESETDEKNAQFHCTMALHSLGSSILYQVKDWGSQGSIGRSIDDAVYRNKPRAFAEAVEEGATSDGAVPRMGQQHKRHQQQ